MNYVSIILSSILCFTAQVNAVETLKPAKEAYAESSPLELGVDAISKIRTAYENGEYDEFLKEMDASYAAVQSEIASTGLADSRSMMLPLKDLQKWEEMALKLNEEKNKELLSALSAEDDSLFAQKVRHLAAFLSKDERNSQNQMLSLRQMAPGMGKNSDENRLIDIDLEYEYKMIHLDKPLLRGTKPSDLREKQYVLRMEKMDKMAEAAALFEDVSLKEVVNSAQASLDKSLALSWDGTDLHALKNGKIKAKTVTEEKVASILISYQGKFTELTRQFVESEWVQH